MVSKSYNYVTKTAYSYNVKFYIPKYFLRYKTLNVAYSSFILSLAAFWETMAHLKIEIVHNQSDQGCQPLDKWIYKLHEISKTGFPVYQLDKGGKHKRSKNGDVYFAVQKVKLSKGIVSKLTNNQLK